LSTTHSEFPIIITIILGFGDVVATKLWLTYYRFDESTQSGSQLTGHVLRQSERRNT